MSEKRCPRCGSPIAPQYRFCPECAFPARAADQLSEKLADHPVPFSLSGELRRFYAVSEVNETSEASLKMTPDSIKEKTFLVTVENGTGGGYYRPGEKVMVKAKIPEDSGLDFYGWEVTEGDVLLSDRMIDEAYFTMPKANVSVTARLSDIKYTVTVTNGEGGGKYSAGEKVTLTANKAVEKHAFDSWEIKSGDIILSDLTSEKAFFYMPRNDVEISAVFKEKIAILTVKNGTADATELYVGETTVLTANKADNGYIFTGWEIEGDAAVEDPQKEQTTLTVGNGEVTAVAKYDVIPTLKPGDELHDIFLELAGSVINGIKQEYDQKIKRFGRSDTAPSEGVKTISISDTDQVVLAWYDDTDGTIYWYSNGKLVSLNEHGGGMFAGFAALREIDFTGIDTKNVTDMSSMFNGCSSLLNLDLSSFNTENVTDMSEMFCNCSSLTSLDLSSFNTENVSYLRHTFYNCGSLTDLKTTDVMILGQYSIK